MKIIIFMVLILKNIILIIKIYFLSFKKEQTKNFKIIRIK